MKSKHLLEFYSSYQDMEIVTYMYNCMDSMGYLNHTCQNVKSKLSFYWNSIDHTRKWK